MSEGGLPTKNCPTESAWMELAAGVHTGAEADALLTHAAECTACAAQLRAALTVFSDATDGDQEPLRLNVTAMAARMALPPVVEMRSPRAAAFQWVAAAAAAVAVSAGLWYAMKSEPPLRLLAKSYEAHRPFEMRIGGAPYSPVRVQRGAGGSDLSPELYEARAAITRRLDSNPKDAEALHARGVADLLEWQMDPAIGSFEAAAGLGLDTPEFLTDFGTAYFERGESSGSGEDYARAEKKLTLALGKRPDSMVARFNRGLVYTRLKKMDAARADFEAVIQADPDAGWRQEAQRMLADVH